MTQLAEQLIGELEELGIVTADQLAELSARGVILPQSTGEIARLLLDEQIITPFQYEAIADGRAHDLVIGPYILRDTIGSGGMGRVYKAVHRTMDRVAALKVLPDAALRDAGAVRQFQREIKAAAQLAHPNIVHVYDAGQSSRGHFLVMEFVEGVDLRTHVRRHGPLSVDDAVKIMVQVSLGLDYAHNKGIVHCDIKPENLLLTREGSIKILDLGLARMGPVRARAPDEPPSKIMGSVDFMSPEQAMTPPEIDGRADLYSLGCTLYFLLTGKPIYAGDNALEKLVAHVECPIPSLVEVRLDVPTTLDRIFQRMTAKQAKTRYATMRELVADLQECRLATSRMLGVVRDWTKSAWQGPPIETNVAANAQSHDTAPEIDMLLERLKDTVTTGPAPRSPWSWRASGKLMLSAGVLLGAAGVLAVLLARPTDVSRAARSNVGSFEPEMKDVQPLAAADNPDAHAAAWVLRNSGSVRVPSVLGGHFEINSVDQLPRDAFHVSGVGLSHAPVDDADLQHFAKLGRLEHLVLNSTAVSDAGLAHLSRLPALTHLELNDTTVSDHGCSVLRGMVRLQMLKMRGTRISDAGIRLLIGLSQLQCLDLEGTSLSDSGLEQIHMLRHLRWLNLSRTGVGNRGLQKICECAELTSLELCATRVTNEGLRHLKSLPGLQWLDLRGTRVTDAGLIALQHTPHLALVLLADTGVTAAAIAEFQVKHPRCVVRK